MTTTTPPILVRMNGQDMTLGAAIQAARRTRPGRKRKTMTRSDLATATGISYYALSLIEHGIITNPGMETVARIFDSLGLDSLTLTIAQPQTQPQTQEEG